MAAEASADAQGERKSTHVVVESRGAKETGSAKTEAVSSKCILLDIEGTICPISFVKATLFPYAVKALPEVLATKWDDEDFIPYRDAFPEEKRTSPKVLQAYVEELTLNDRKDACHKNLQGYLWENGYKTGAYATPLFPDVAPRLKEWKEAGLTLAIYSSGSVFAQKLLFEHVQVKPPPLAPADEDLSVASVDQAAVGQKRSLEADAALKREPQAKRQATEGQNDHTNAATEAPSDHRDSEPVTEDLQYLITDWFDTVNAGPKKEASSYKKIAEKLKLAAAEILFLTDSVEEYDASIAAGLQAGLMVRPGNPPLSDEGDVKRFEMMSSLQDTRPRVEN